MRNIAHERNSRSLVRSRRPSRGSQEYRGNARTIPLRVAAREPRHSVGSCNLQDASFALGRDWSIPPLVDPHSRGRPALTNLSCAIGILFESILHPNDVQSGFNTAKTRCGRSGLRTLRTHPARACRPMIDRSGFETPFRKAAIDREQLAIRWPARCAEFQLDGEMSGRIRMAG
jgi:hypothetical protein